MPRLEDVEELFHCRLQADAPAQFQQAGAVWKSVPLSHYYLDETAAEIVAADIAVQTATIDGLKLSGRIVRMLQDDIGVKTTVVEAINRVFIAVSTPVNG